MDGIYNFKKVEDKKKADDACCNFEPSDKSGWWF